MVKKKRDGNGDLFINFDKKKINSFFREFNKAFNKNLRFFRNNIDVVKKTFTNYEEPYCELNQNYRGINIKVKLPDVKKKNIVLNVFDDKIELKAESRFKDENNKTNFRIFHRIIDLPSCSVVSKTRAEFKNNKLRIKIPFKKIK